MAVMLMVLGAEEVFRLPHRDVRTDPRSVLRLANQLGADARLHQPRLDGFQGRSRWGKEILHLLLGPMLACGHVRLLLR